MIGYTSTPTNFYEDYICHHGIKGMKWGRRKSNLRDLGYPNSMGGDKGSHWKRGIEAGRSRIKASKRKKLNTTARKAYKERLDNERRTRVFNQHMIDDIIDGKIASSYYKEALKRRKGFEYSKMNNKGFKTASRV